MAEACSQVDSDPAAVAQSTNPIQNGKRGAEEVVEPQVEGNKKHKVSENMSSEMEEGIKEEHCSYEEQNKVEVASAIKSATTTQDDAERTSISNAHEEDKDDSFKEDHQHLEAQKKTVDSDPVVVAQPTNPIQNGKRGAKEVVEPQVEGNKRHKVSENMSSEMEECIKEEHCSSQEQNKVEIPSAIKSVTTTEDDVEKASISDAYEEEDKDDSFKEDYQHLEAQKRSVLKLNNDLGTERAEDHPTHDTGSKTLYLGNLSFAIEEDDVRDFFKNVGEIAGIRFAIKDDRFMGYGHIEFATVEAAQEALKLNKEVLLDRPVKLDFARRERGAYTPGNSMDKTNQRGGHAQVRTIYVRGFESSDGFDNIKSALEKHFGKCGEISRLCIPKDHASGAPRGVAFVEFTDSNGFSQALGLDGSEIGGNRLTVEKAKKPRRDDREGSGYGGGGWSGSGGGWSGSGGGWSGSGGGGWSGSGGGGWSGSGGGGWSGSGGGWSGSGGGWSGSGGGWSGSRGEWSGSASGMDGQSGSSGNSVRQSGSGGSWVRESGGYGRESSTGGGWHRESGYGGKSNMERGSGNNWHRESGSRRESSYGRGGGGWGWESRSRYDGGRGRESGSNDGGFSSSRVGSGSGFSGSRYSSSSSRHHGGSSFRRGGYDSR